MPSGSANKETKGWYQEKMKFLSDMAENAIEKIKKDGKLVKMFQNLVLGKQLILQSILKRIETNNQNLNMNEQKIALDIIKRELGEPLNDVANIGIGITIDDVLRRQEAEPTIDL